MPNEGVIKYRVLHPDGRITYPVGTAEDHLRYEASEISFEELIELAEEQTLEPARLA
jgi:hypothetical protein